MTFEHCKQYPDEYPRKRVEDIPELRDNLVLISRDFRTWISVYECSECGQPWEETYTSLGHADIASVRKLTAVEVEEDE